MKKSINQTPKKGLKEGSAIIQDLVNQLVAKELQNRLDTAKREKKKESHKRKSKKDGKRNKKGKDYIETMITDGKKSSLIDKKSPSDTSMYVPALRKKRVDQSINSLANSLPKLSIEIDKAKGQTNDEITKELNNNMISIQLEKIRKQAEKHHHRDSASKDRGDFYRKSEEQPKMRDAKELAEQAIINAEKFKAEIAPAGMLVPHVDLDFDDNKDEEFSQVDCHLEPNIITKIAKGGFIEVEKLIQKQIGKLRNEEGGKMELVDKDGVKMSFLVPKGEKEQKITNVRRWEQGFKVYAAVYSRFNPHRGAEIWQYIHTINLAASSYSWDNVAYYDYMFRQQMAKYPQRSWKKVNNQLWSLAMRDPISHRNNNNNNSFNMKGDWRDNCCWRYNKGKCKRSANECRYEHKCSWCGGSHPAIHCFKKKKTNDPAHGSSSNSETPRKPRSNNHQKKQSQSSKSAENE